jgi:hypothetical protein
MRENFVSSMETGEQVSVEKCILIIIKKDDLEWFVFLCVKRQSTIEQKKNGGLINLQSSLKIILYNSL